MFRPDPKPEKKPKVTQFKAIQRRKSKKPMDISTPKKKPVKTVNKRLIDECDKLFSIIVRQSGMNDMGINKCYTCGYPDYWSNLECGHFLSRRHFTTRWDFNNARPQCTNCNVGLSGNIEIYEKKLKTEIGGQVVDELKNKARKRFTYDLRDILLNLKQIAKCG